jgi:hypothetical protein
LFAACVIDDPTATSESGQEATSTNGVSMNGVSMNGVSVNGVSVNGVSVNGPTLTGIQTKTGLSYTASSIGAKFTAALSTGGTVTLRIDAASALAAPNTDVWSYGISYSTSAGWMPLCGDAAVRALQIPGAFGNDGAFTASSTSFTFACRGSSVAKCVELGYNPARGLADHMVSCVRLLRGDYCGTGVPYTVTGNLVNIFGSLGIQEDTQIGWMPEAEWAPSGARCISLARFTRFEAMGLMPACIASGALPATLGCGVRGFSAGTLLISEIPLAMPTASTTTSKTSTSLKTSTK